MKKTLFLALILILSLAVSACGVSYNSNENDSELTEDSYHQEDYTGVEEQQADLIEEKTLTEYVEKCLFKYSLVLDEAFGVKYDDSISYYRLYAEEDTEYLDTVGMISSDALNSLSSPEGDKNGLIHYAGFVVDPSFADCYLVLDFYSYDDIRKEYSKYMAEDVFLDVMTENFIEEGGFIYLVRGGRSYGTTEMGDFEIKEETSDSIIAEAEKRVNNEPDGKFVFSFSVDAHREPMVKLEKVETE